ncbi:MFS transporter [Arthrobacter sp. BHU FT2]|nr:MFS transporter [Arthrobacter sp. BHU FT2]
MTAEQVTIQAEPKTSYKKWFVALTVLVVLTEQSALGFQLISPALIGLATEFQAPDIVWTITVFVLVGAISTPLVGKLGDRYGKRNVLLVVAAVALIGSLVSALAPTYPVLLLGRALTGVSTAFLPITVALVRDVFPERIRPVSIAICTNGVGVVTVLGPFLAGWLIDTWGARSIFWFIAALSLIGAVGCIALVPETPVRNKARIDVLGAAWLTVGILILMWGLRPAQANLMADPSSVGAIVLGIVLLVTWWLAERRIKVPFIDTKLLATRPISTVILLNALISAAITVVASYLPSMLQTPGEVTGGIYGFGADASGVALFLLPAGVVTVLGGLSVGWGAPRIGYRFFLLLGSACMITSGLVIGLLRTEPWMPTVGWVFGGLAAMVWAACQGLLMEVAPVEHRGVSAGMLGAVSGALGSITVQIAGLIAGSFVVSTLGGGFPIYSATGVALPFLIAAGLGAVAFLVALTAPRTRASQPVRGAAH